MIYRLAVVRIFSFRWDESLAFYRGRVGLPVAALSEEAGWAQFDLGTAQMVLERCDPADPESRELVGRFVGVSVEVENIQQTYERPMAAGVEFVGPPERQPWGGTLAHFRDPDGNILTLLGVSVPATVARHAP